MCMYIIKYFSPSWARAGWKKTLSLIHYPLWNKVHSFIHSFIHSSWIPHQSPCCVSGCMIPAFIDVSCRAWHADQRGGDPTGPDGEHGEGGFQFSLLPPITNLHQAAGLDRTVPILFPFLCSLFSILVAGHERTSYSVLRCSTPSMSAALLRRSKPK